MNPGCSINDYFYLFIYFNRCLTITSPPPDVTGQQQHFFDSRLTYHASRSAAAVGVAMGAGYSLANNWGYTNYSSYLGYGGGGGVGMPGAAAYQTAPGLGSYSSPVLDPLAPVNPAALPVTSETTSPSGVYTVQVLVHTLSTRWPVPIF